MNDFATTPGIPDISNDFPGRRIDLLDRLRHWPDYEPDGARRAGAIRRWRQAVRARMEQGAPRRVLFVHAQLPGETGSGVYLQQIAAASLRQGRDLYVLSAGYHHLSERDIRGVPDERIFTCRFTRAGEVPRAGAVQTPISGMSVVMPYHVLAYRDRTREELLDWLTVFGGHLTDLVARLQPDVIHVDHLWFLNGLARLVAPWIPLVASAHGTAYKLIVDTPRLRELVAPCVASADHVCAISPESVTECREMFGIPAQRISIEGYGYEPALFDYRPVARDTVVRDILGVDLGGVDQMILAVGKFVDWKGFRELTVAVGQLVDRGLDPVALIVGEGDPQSRADLERFIADRGLRERVRLPGKVARDRLPDIYRAADAYILPSHVEPYGLVLMEALACGAPSVCAETGGPPHYVPRTLRERGWVRMVTPIDLNADGVPDAPARERYATDLAEGLQQVLQAEIGPSERQAIAEAMRPLSWERLVVSLGHIFDRLVEQALFS